MRLKILIFVIILLVISGCSTEKGEIKSEDKNLRVVAGKTTSLGSLEITVVNSSEITYVSLEHNTINDISGVQRINKSYQKVYVKAFNSDWENGIALTSIKLVDSSGKEYLPSSNPDFDKFREFGRDMVVYPRVVREGYLVFLDARGKNLRLVFETGSDKIVFNLDDI